MESMTYEPSTISYWPKDFRAQSSYLPPIFLCLTRHFEFSKSKAESRAQPSTYYFTWLGWVDCGGAGAQLIDNVGVMRGEN